jgi:hypothetical protein
LSPSLAHGNLIEVSWTNLAAINNCMSFGQFYVGIQVLYVRNFSWHRCVAIDQRAFASWNRTLPTASIGGCTLKKDSDMTNQPTNFDDGKTSNAAVETLGKPACVISVMAYAAIPFIGLMFTGGAAAETIEPRVKTLSIYADRVATDGLVLQLELEGSEPMWMQMGSPPVWGEHLAGADERFHVEVKVTDPVTKTRIPYAGVTFAAKLAETGKTMSMALPPMWGSSGLHYSDNSALLGDGTYGAIVTVDVPTFQRELKDKELWSSPVSAKFHFKFKDGKLTEVSETSP